MEKTVKEHQLDEHCEEGSLQLIETEKITLPCTSEVRKTKKKKTQWRPFNIPVFINDFRTLSESSIAEEFGGKKKIIWTKN